MPAILTDSLLRLYHGRDILCPTTLFPRFVISSIVEEIVSIITLYAYVNQYLELSASQSVSIGIFISVSSMESLLKHKHPYLALRNSIFFL